MYGFYYHFNNLRFKQTQQINDCSAAHVVIPFVSSKHLRCRLLKWMLDHPTSHALRWKSIPRNSWPRTFDSTFWKPCTENLYSAARKSTLYVTLTKNVWLKLRISSKGAYLRISEAQEQTKGPSLQSRMIPSQGREHLHLRGSMLHLHICFRGSCLKTNAGKIPVSVKKAPPEKKTRRTISFKNTNSGAGEPFLLQDWMAEARVK